MQGMHQNTAYNFEEVSHYATECLTLIKCQDTVINVGIGGTNMRQTGIKSDPHIFKWPQVDDNFSRL